MYVCRVCVCVCVSCGCCLTVVLTLFPSVSSIPPLLWCCEESFHDNRLILLVVLGRWFCAAAGTLLPNATIDEIFILKDKEEIERHRQRENDVTNN